MSETQTKIQQFFAEPLRAQKIKEILTRGNAYSDETWQEFVRSLVDGDRDLSMLGDYLSAEFDLPFEAAEKISDDLMDAGLSEIYFDIFQNYSDHQKEMAEFAAEAFGEENETEEEGEEESVETEETPVTEETSAPQIKPEPKQISISAAETPADLGSLYNQFANSSLFQNALEAEKTIKAQSSGDSAKLKNLFYEAINAADVVKFVGALRLVFGGGVKKFFTGDNRYTDFMNKFLSRTPGNGAIQEFSASPAAKKFVIQFIRLILEKKLHLSEAESALIGVSLGSIAHNSGEEDFADVAFGDEEANKFLWNE